MFFKFTRSACPRVECDKKGEKEVSFESIRRTRKDMLEEKRDMQTHVRESELIWYIGPCVLSRRKCIALSSIDVLTVRSPLYPSLHTRTYYESIELEEKRKTRRNKIYFAGRDTQSRSYYLLFLTFHIISFTQLL